MLQKTVILLFLLALGPVSTGRTRRHLVFNKGSRLFFSIDLRDNLFHYSDFFAQVLGVKIDWDLPSGVAQGTNKGRLQRRDLYQGVEQFLHLQDINGTSCMKKFVCEALAVLPKSNHFLAQLYEVIFSPTMYEDGYNMDPDTGCTHTLLTSTECPLSLTTLFSGRLKIFSN